MASWPSTLPDYLQIDGGQISFGDNVIRSSMDVGPDKVRRRTTTTPDIVTGSQYLNSTQFSTLQTFYKTTCAGGSLSFDWKHPVTRSTVYMRFVEPPKCTAIGGNIWRVDYVLEILP